MPTEVLNEATLQTERPEGARDQAQSPDIAQIYAMLKDPKYIKNSEPDVRLASAFNDLVGALGHNRNSVSVATALATYALGGSQSFGLTSENGFEKQLEFRYAQGLLDCVLSNIDFDHNPDKLRPLDLVVDSLFEEVQEIVTNPDENWKATLTKYQVMAANPTLMRDMAIHLWLCIEDLCERLPSNWSQDCIV